MAGYGLWKLPLVHFPAPVVAAKVARYDNVEVMRFWGTNARSVRRQACKLRRWRPAHRVSRWAGDRHIPLAGQLLRLPESMPAPGGPCCEGVIMNKVEDVLGPDKTWRGQRFDESEAHFVCPWHGYEYDMKTGECVGNRSLRLKSYATLKRGEDLYVLTG